MNNVTGQPVEGEDFFDRVMETQDLWETLKEGNHVLLLAPRRVGKTSLSLRVGAQAAKEGWKFVLVDVQRDRDELSFLDNLFQNLKSAGVKVPALAKLTEWVTFARRNLRGKVEAGGFGVELDPHEADQTTTLEHQIERLFAELEDSGDRLLIAVDELPVLLEALEEGEKGEVRLRSFLNWFRALRLRYRKNVRWLLLGSVGLDTFVEVRNLTATINDLQSSSLGAYPESIAIEFLKELGRSKGITFSNEHCMAILTEIGWPLPFFLQLVFHELYSLLGRPPRDVKNEDVKDACQRLLAPQFYKHFEPWRSRLSEGMSPDHHRAAASVLSALAINPQGLTRAILLDEVSAKSPQRDPDEIKRILATTLGQLERDGYVLRNSDGDGAAAKYAFRSFLLRNYWHARELA